MCGDIVTPKGNQVCSECYEKAKIVEEPRCMKCGKYVGQEEQEYCYDCSGTDTYFEKGFSLWHYDTVLKHSIAQFKYHNRKEYALFYGTEFVKEFKEQIEALEIDAIIPVPIHWTRHVQRGYNQAEEVANIIGRALNIPVVDDLLIRSRKTVAQKQLDDKQRQKNLENAFELSKKWKNISGNLNRVMIIDDIYTTGCTISACAKVLKEFGIQQVYFGVLCIGSGY